MISLLDVFMAIMYLLFLSFFGALIGLMIAVFAGWEVSTSYLWAGAWGATVGAFLEEVFWRRRMMNRIKAQV